MSGHVKVEDLEVFRQFRTALIKFAQAAEQSLSGADSHISRTRNWLTGEQMSLWQTQLRKRTEAVTRARDAVRQKKVYKDASGGRRDASEEEKELSRCEAALAIAQQKIHAIRAALPKLERESDLYRGGVARLSAALGGDIPRAVALLDNLAIRLHEYIQINSPAGDLPVTAPLDTAPPADVETPIAAETQTPPSAQPPLQKPEEDAHVARGQ